MEFSLNSATIYCKHCSTIVPSVRGDGFCCNGCEAVYQILTRAGLSEYYQIKENAVCYQKPKPATLIKQKFDFVSNSSQVKFYLEGIHCTACVWLLEKLPMIMPEAVASCFLNLNTSVLSITLKKPNFVNDVAQKIDEWGYHPHLISADHQVNEKIEKENKKRLLDLGVAGAIAGNVMLMSIPLYSGVSGSMGRMFEVLSFVLSVPSLFFSGRTFFKNVYSGFKSKIFPIDAPILLALVIAFFYSTYSLVQNTHQLYFDSLTALIFLLLASRYYLSRLRQSSQMNLGVLDFFQEDSKLQVGEFEILKQNEKVHFDGIVRKGEGWCDYSQFTGESDPVKVQAGDPIYAGTIFLESNTEVLVEVQKTGKDTRLAQLLQKVSEVQMKRTKTELTSDRWSQMLLIVVTNVALFSAGFFIMNGNASEGIKRILALLIVTCPCALALATPLVFTLAIKNLLKKGLLIKDPTSLDRLPEVKKVFFDKTGTLTEGRLQAEVDFEKLSNEDSNALYSMVSLSRHPVSRAIERAFAEKGMNPKLLKWNSFNEKMGTGLFANKGSEYSLERAKESKSEFTETSFFKNGLEISRIVLQDRTRAESKSIVKYLQDKGMNVSILSGDHDSPVRKLADELKVNQCFSLKNPDQKSFYVHDEMMVGDGVNDALALSSAHVSVAVQGGMEAAIQSAQVFSLNPGIHTIIPLVETAHLVRLTLRQNFILSTSYNLVGAILSLSGFMSPLIAAILMPASALTVFWSSMIRMRERTK